MRSLPSALSVTLVTLLLAACAAEAPTPQPPPSRGQGAAPPPISQPADVAPPPSPPSKMTTAEAAKVALPAYLEALNQHDAKRFAGFFTEDATLVLPGIEPLKGRAAIIAAAQKWFDTFSSLKIAATRVLVKGDVVVHEWAMTGTHSGDFRGVKPTEKPVGLNGVSLAWFDPDSGLIKEEHRYADTATLMSQIGASKTKGRPIPLLSSSPEWRAAHGSPDEEKSADVWKKIASALNAKNEADYLALHADDVAYDDLTQPVTMRGQKDLKKWFQGFVAAFPDAQANVVNAWGIDEYAVAEMTVTGTHKASKKSVTLHAVEITQTKDGKIAHGWSYGDGAEVAKQIAPPPPPPPPPPGAGAGASAGAPKKK